jgi:glycerol uptake facilitator-like aquaporin
VNDISLTDAPLGAPSKKKREVEFALSRRLAAEAGGTALLVAAVVGSGIMAERLAGGNVAVALLANTIATGAMLAVLIVALGPISGAQFNPAVTLVAAVRREIEASTAAFYIAAQIAGGVLGTVLAHAMFDLPLLAASTHVRAGPAQLLSEFVAAFGLVATILATIRFRPAAAPYSVALYVVAGYWFTASTCFANPAVAVARALTDSFAGIRPEDVPGFIAAELAGGLAAAAVFAWLVRPKSRS